MLKVYLPITVADEVLAVDEVLPALRRGPQAVYKIDRHVKRTLLGQSQGCGPGLKMVGSGSVYFPTEKTRSGSDLIK